MLNSKYKLGECCTIIAGQSPESKYYNLNGDGLPFFQGKADFGDVYPQIRVYCSQPIKIAEKDDILLSVRAPVGPTNLAPCKVCIGRGLTAIRPKDFLLTKYLLLYLKSFELELASQGKGTTFKSITQNIIKNLEIWIPSIEKQKQIVKQIEESLSQLDSAVATLNKTKQQLEIYRQAVLKEEFDRIVNISRIIPIKDVCTDIKVGIVIKPAQYYTGSQNSIKAFRSANVKEFMVNDSDWVYITKEGHEKNKRSEIHTNDVLIVRSGYPGTACVVPERFNGCNAIDILIAVPNTNIVNSDYLCAYTNSPYGKRLVREKKRGVAQAHLNVSGYSRMNIMIPDLDVQKDVVKEINSQVTQVDSILETVNGLLLQTEALRQSILKQAFEVE